MKKLFAALLVSGLTLSGFSATNVEAASGNSIQSIKQLEQGDQEIEGAELGASIETVLASNKKPLYSYSPDGDEHYYEFKKDNGVLIVTADGKKGKGKILRASMVYDEPNGPSFNEVKKEVSNKASIREHYNDVTGNIGYIQDDNLSYQFTTTSPDDKDIKLYRIDLS